MKFSVGQNKKKNYKTKARTKTEENGRKWKNNLDLQILYWSHNTCRLQKHIQQKVNKY